MCTGCRENFIHPYKSTQRTGIYPGTEQAHIEHIFHECFQGMNEICGPIYYVFASQSDKESQGILT